MLFVSTETTYELGLMLLTILLAMVAFGFAEWRAVRRPRRDKAKPAHKAANLTQPSLPLLCRSSDAQHPAIGEPNVGTASGSETQNDVVVVVGSVVAIPGSRSCDFPAEEPEEASAAR